MTFLMPLFLSPAFHRSAIFASGRTFVALAFVTLGLTAASAYEDKKTGLKVEPPAPFAVEPTKRPNQDAVAGVYSTTGKPTAATSGKYICEVAFIGASQNAGQSKDDINERIGDPAWQTMATDTVGRIFTINATEEYTLDGFTGFEMIGTPKVGPDAANTRIVLSINETSKGRVTTSCSITASELETALPLVRAIRASITLPQ
jgi:hypothetical protein